MILLVMVHVVQAFKSPPFDISRDKGKPAIATMTWTFEQAHTKVHFFILPNHTLYLSQPSEPMLCKKMKHIRCVCLLNSAPFFLQDKDPSLLGALALHSR